MGGGRADTAFSSSATGKIGLGDSDRVLQAIPVDDGNEEPI